MVRQLPPLKSLRAFEATARHLSFSKAADELAVTPAALSHQVRGLEERLGLELFTRRNRSIELTEAAQLIYPGIHAAFETMSGAQKSFGYCLPASSTDESVCRRARAPPSRRWPARCSGSTG